MKRPGGEASAGRASITVPTAALVIVALAFSWMLLTLLDLREDDGVVPVFAIFGVPAIVSALVIEIAMLRGARSQGLTRGFLWWLLLVLPLGTIAAFGVALLRDPEYFFGDESPWMIIWIPVLVVMALLLGLLVWIFLVFPLVALVQAVVAIARGEAKLSALVMPILLLLLGAVCVIGGTSLETGSSGPAARGAIIAAFFGIPGDYDVVWPPGMWIVRGIVAGIVLAFAVPALIERRRGRADRRRA